MKIQILLILLPLLLLSSCTPEFIAPKKAKVVSSSEPEDPRGEETPLPDPAPGNINHVSCLSLYKSNSELKNGRYLIATIPQRP